jgi:hypothetical protein
MAIPKRGQLVCFPHTRQLFLLEKHITLSASNIVPLVAVVFRSFASMLIDIICAIYLGVTGICSLKKYLQNKRAQWAKHA